MKFNDLIPELSVEDLEKSLAFYRTAGFKVEYRRREEKFAFLSRDGAQLMLEQSSAKPAKAARPGTGIHFQINVKDVEALWRKLQKQGTAVGIPYEKEYRTANGIVALRQFWAEDPDGYRIRFVEEVRGKNKKQRRNKINKEYS